MTYPSSELTALAGRLREVGCVYAEDEAALIVDAASTPEQLEELLDQRLAGVPLEHVLGWAEFAGLHISVAPGVFVPRRRTEILVRQAAGILRSAEVALRRPVVVELCCGAAAVSVALLATHPDLDLHASDLDPAAIGCAERNLAPVDASVHKGDLFDSLPIGLRARVDLVVASPPYVPTDEIALMPAEARLCEPMVALDGGADGLSVARRIVSEAADWLAPGGCLIVEVSAGQASALVDTFEASGFEATAVSDASVDGTAVVGRLPDPAGSGPRAVD